MDLKTFFETSKVNCMTDIYETITSKFYFGSLQSCMLRCLMTSNQQVIICKSSP